MNQLLRQLKTQWGIDEATVGVFGAAIILYGLAWWVRLTSIRLSIGVFELAGGILMVNLALSILAARKDITLGYLLAGTALLGQLLLLILIWKASQGAF